MSNKTLLISLQVVALNVVGFPSSIGQGTAHNYQILEADSQKQWLKPVFKTKNNLYDYKKAEFNTRTTKETNNPKHYTWGDLTERIKKREHLMLGAYKCDAGVLTVGYGHSIKKSDRLRFPNIEKEGITKEQAEMFLHEDLEYCKNFVKNNLKLKGTRLIAITNFCYAFGTTKLFRSSLYKKIKANEPIDSEIRKWVHINGKPAKNLQREREFELALYNANLS